MAHEITTPRLGWSMEEGVFVEWLKQDGERVEKGEMLFVLEGEKAAQEIECFHAGVLRIPPDGPQPGQTVAVGQLLGYLVAEGEAAPFERSAEASNPAANPAATSAASRSSDAQSTPSGPAARRRARQETQRTDVAPATSPADSGDVLPPTSIAPRPAGGSVTASGGRAGRPRATPRARRAARRGKVDLTQIAGSGSGGRIRERDVLAALEQNGERAATPVAHQATHLTPLRRTIARRMLSGSRDTAPVTLFSRADATNLRSLQEQFRSGQTPDDFTPSLNDLLLKLAGAALREHPHIRTQWRDEQLVIPEAFDLAFAVQTPYGLTAPVVRNVPQRSLRELAAETQRLIAGARARRLSAEDLSGAVLTVTNLGHLDVEAFTPILSPPQSVVLGIGKIVREPVVVGEEIDIRDIVRLSMTFDHRVHDGDPAARFLQQVCACIENPGPWLVQ